MTLIFANLLFSVLLYMMLEKLATKVKYFLDGFPFFTSVSVPFAYFLIFFFYFWSVFNFNSTIFLDYNDLEISRLSGGLFQISLLCGAVLTLWLTLFFSLAESYKRRLASQFVWCWRRQAYIQLPQFFISFTMLISFLPELQSYFFSVEYAVKLNAYIYSFERFPIFSEYSLYSISLLTIVITIFVPLFLGHIRMVNGVIQSNSVSFDYFDRIVGVENITPEMFEEKVWNPGIESFEKLCFLKENSEARYMQKWLGHILSVRKIDEKMDADVLVRMDNELQKIKGNDT